jgi:hypothetical protein
MEILMSHAAGHGHCADIHAYDGRDLDPVIPWILRAYGWRWTCGFTVVMTILAVLRDAMHDPVGMVLLSITLACAVAYVAGLSWLRWRHHVVPGARAGSWRCIDTGWPCILMLWAWIIGVMVLNTCPWIRHAIDPHIRVMVFIMMMTYIIFSGWSFIQGHIQRALISIVMLVPLTFVSLYVSISIASSASLPFVHGIGVSAIAMSMIMLVLMIPRSSRKTDVAPSVRSMIADMIWAMRNHHSSTLNLPDFMKAHDLSRSMPVIWSAITSVPLHAYATDIIAWMERHPSVIAYPCPDALRHAVLSPRMGIRDHALFIVKTIAHMRDPSSVIDGHREQIIVHAAEAMDRDPESALAVMHRVVSSDDRTPDAGRSSPIGNEH